MLYRNLVIEVFSVRCKWHDKTLRIKKEFQYKENSGGDSSGDTEKEDHTEGPRMSTRTPTSIKRMGRNQRAKMKTLMTGERKQRSTGGARHSGKAPHTQPLKGTRHRPRQLAGGNSHQHNRLTLVGSIPARRHRRKCHAVQRTTMIQATGCTRRLMIPERHHHHWEQVHNREPKDPDTTRERSSRECV